MLDGEASISHCKCQYSVYINMSIQILLILHHNASSVHCKVKNLAVGNKICLFAFEVTSIA